MTDPLAPQPMTPEQVDDLVNRTRANSDRLARETFQRMRAGEEAYRMRRSYTRRTRG